MSNLLPSEGKKIIVREYRLRVVTVWACLWGIVVCALICTLAPTYVFLDGQRAHLESNPSISPDESLSDGSLASIKDTNALVARLGEDDPMLSVTPIIAAVNEVADERISIGAYRVVREGIALSSITIEGVAASREALSTFQSALEAHALFENADVPISDLVRDRDLPFSIMVTIAPAYAK